MVVSGTASILEPAAPFAPVGLREKGAVLLLSCYEMGHQPYGLAAILALLEQEGYGPAAVDLSVEDFPSEKVRRAQFVGISVPMHTALRLGVEVITQVRTTNPECHICVYGLYASLNEEYLLRHGADSCIGGSGEGQIIALLAGSENGKGLPVSGVSIAGARQTPQLSRPLALVPRRQDLPLLSRYAHAIIDDESRAVAYVEASRGCLHLCRHCPIPSVYHGRFFAIPTEAVMADIRQQVALGASHVTFGDPDFLNGPGHAMRLARLFHAEFPDLTFDCTIKIEHIIQRPHLFPELRECGCAFVVSAVESLSDEVLRILDKGHSRQEVIEALQVLGDAGIAMRPTWMPFTPWSTPEDYLDLFTFVETYNLIDHVDPIQYSIRLLIPPGSLLLDRPEMQPYLGRLVEENFSYSWRCKDPRMDRLASEVAGLVEGATLADADPTDTFYDIWQLAANYLCPPVQIARRHLPPGRKRAPRLTEPWFC